MRSVLFVESLFIGLVMTLLVCTRPPAVFLRSPHARTNFRGRQVAGTLGVVLALPLVAGAAIALGAGSRPRTVVTIAVAGLFLGLVGLVDDLYGDRHAGGLIGHARALVRGRFTTGTLKAVSGAAVGLAAAWALGWRGGWLLIAGGVVALAANTANLLDLRPGRTVKVSLVAFVVLAAVAGLTDGVLTTTALAGGAAGFLEADLRERGMLGDGGAALLGAGLGAAAVSSADRAGVLAVFVALAALTAASEVVSFTRVIERVPPLRYLDSIGRLKS